MSTQPNQPHRMSGADWLKYFRYMPERDSPSDVRNALLVVMALIAAATFQAALNPPGGVWQQTMNDNGIWIGLVSFVATYASSTISLNIRSAACLNGQLVAVAIFFPVVTMFVAEGARRRFSTGQ
ncbi:uncharacterized protein LOC122299897 [Carya illinoinensis]|uniref:uncharacterized protein LOC122299897 n=1 Tax=Carya illinoinensis TaxID=32201 RepID=UPI001C71E7B3|nr:uncharacterized protein LOC122299897 [Carya illinoinensis]